MKGDLIKVFIEQVYSESSRKNNTTNKTTFNQIVEKWSTDLMDISDYKNSNNILYRCISVVIDNISKLTWSIPLKKNSAQTKTDEFKIVLIASKQKPIKIENH